MEFSEISQFLLKRVKPPSQGGDYFQTHDVAGTTVIRTREFNLGRKGYSGETQRLVVKEITTPIFDETGEYVIRGLRYDLPFHDEIDKSKPHYSLVFMGGGASEAVGNIDWMGKIIDAWNCNADSIREQLPFRIDKIILLPHIGGSPRTRGEKDVNVQDTLAGAGKILQQALNSPEYNISNEGLIFAGYSEGGNQMTELAASYGDRCKHLLLADPAGMASHPDLLKQVSIGEILAAIKKYRGTPHALSKALWETRLAWGSTEQKVPDLLDMVKDFRSRSPWSQEVAKAYGFDREQANTAANVKPAMTDSTVIARRSITAEVVFSPVMGANVVNVVVARLKDKYPTPEAVLTADQIQLEQDVISLLHDMFPKVKAVYFAGYRDTTHSAARAEQGFLEHLFEVFTDKVTPPKITMQSE